MQRDCDFKRINRACTTVQANILSLINKDSLVTVRDNIKKRKADSISSDSDEAENSILIDLAIETNEVFKSLFNQSQGVITKAIAEQYSKSQHNLMKQSMK